MVTQDPREAALTRPVITVLYWQTFLAFSLIISKCFRCKSWIFRNISMQDKDVSIAKKEVDAERNVPSAPKITDAEAANVIQKGDS